MTLKVCAVINLAVIPLTEGMAPFYEIFNLGPFILISNALIAFLLNIAAVFLVGAGSGLVLTLAGVFKVRTAVTSTFPLSFFSGYFVPIAGLRCHAITSSYSLSFRSCSRVPSISHCQCTDC